MPRRKLPIQRAVTGGSVVHGTHQQELVEVAVWLRAAQPSTAALSAAQIDGMALRIVEAVGHARADWRPMFADKGAKADAWRLDMFSADLAHAWEECGLAVGTGETSPFVRFVNAVADKFGLLEGRSSLVNSAKRGREIERLG